MKVSEKNSDGSSVNSASIGQNNYMPRWNHIVPYSSQPSFSKDFVMNTNFQFQQSKHEKQSLSNQTTGQASEEASKMVKDNNRDHFILAQCGNDSFIGEQFEGQLKPVLSPLYQEGMLQKFDCCQPIAVFAYPYADLSFYGGAMASYESPAIMNPWMIGAVPPGRVPLPLEPAEDEPIYVNAKQYNGILRRRQLRAKLEAQNKLIKERKPYLHESRHLHAMKRPRGSGGRFLNTKKKKKQHSPTDAQNQSHTLLNPSSSEPHDVLSNGFDFQQLDRHLRFASDFLPHLAGRIASDSGPIHAGNCHQVPVMR